MHLRTVHAFLLGLLFSQNLPAQQPGPGAEPGLRLLLDNNYSTAEGLCWSADGKVLVGAANGPDTTTMVIKLRDAHSGKTLVDVGSHHPFIHGLAMTRDGKTVVAEGEWKPIPAQTQQGSR